MRLHIKEHQQVPRFTHTLCPRKVDGDMWAYVACPNHIVGTLFIIDLNKCLIKYLYNKLHTTATILLSVEC